MAYSGDAAGSRATADAALSHASELFEYYEGSVHTAVAHAHLAAGDATAAWEAFEAARARSGLDLRIASTLQLGGACAVGMWRSRTSPVAGPTTSCR